MQLDPFEYHQPASLDDAIAALTRLGETAAPLAGGTELLLLMKMGLADVAHLVNLKRIPSLDAIAFQDGTLRIGALATHARVASDALVRRHVPALAALCGSIANVRVRNSGTLGGNLCFAEPRADPPVLLAALGAEVELAGPSGRRRMPLDSFIIEPLTTALEPAEIMTAILVPATGAPSACERIARGSHSLATAAVALGADARVQAGHGGGWLRLARASELLAASAGPPDEASFAQAAAEDIADVDMTSDVEASADYRRHLVAVAAVRAMRAAIAGGGGGAHG